MFIKIPKFQLMLFFLQLLFNLQKIQNLPFYFFQYYPLNSFFLLALYYLNLKVIFYPHHFSNNLLKKTSNHLQFQLFYPMIHEFHLKTNI